MTSHATLLQHIRRDTLTHVAHQPQYGRMRFMNN
jgi:hypothetical protein